MKKLVVTEELRRNSSRVELHFALSCGSTRSELHCIMGRKLLTFDVSDTYICNKCYRRRG